MKWSDTYATGVDRIDQHHRMLFQMAEDFRVSLEEGGGERVYRVMLHSLELYALAHFRYEERCMTEYQCPAAELNKNAHAGFIEMLSEYRRRHESYGFVASEARSLVDTVDHWLAAHIARIDTRLRDFLPAPPG